MLLNLFTSIRIAACYLVVLGALCLCGATWASAAEPLTGDAAGAQNVLRMVAAAEYAHYADTHGYGTLDELIAGKKLAATIQEDTSTAGMELSIAISEDREYFTVTALTKDQAVWFVDRTGVVSQLDAAVAAKALIALAQSEKDATTTQQGDTKTMTDAQPTVATVVLETTKGNITLAVHYDWAPIGAARFIELVNGGFYNGAPWFRVINGFVAQCGISADPKLNTAWDNNTIKDDPVVKGNQRGTLAFGKTSMPNSRTTHVYINLVDNGSRLDGQGFAAFAEITDGLDVADKLAKCEFQDQYGLMQEGGLAKFKAAYPDADYILKAYVQ